MIPAVCLYVYVCVSKDAVSMVILCVLEFTCDCNIRCVSVCACNTVIYVSGKARLLKDQSTFFFKFYLFNCTSHILCTAKNINNMSEF